MPARDRNRVEGSAQQTLDAARDALATMSEQPVGVVGAANAKWAQNLVECAETLIGSTSPGVVIEAVAARILVGIDQGAYPILELLLDIVSVIDATSESRNLPTEPDIQLLVEVLRTALDWQLEYYRAMQVHKQTSASNSTEEAFAIFEGTVIRSGLRDRWWYPWPAFEAIAREISRQLPKSSDNDDTFMVIDAIPLTVSDVIETSKAIAGLTTYRVFGRRLAASEVTKSGLTDEQLQHYDLKLSTSEGRLLSFTLEEITFLSGVDAVKCRAFIDALLLEEEVVRRAFVGRTRPTLFVSNHDLRSRPLLKVGIDEYLLPGPFHLLTAVLSLCERTWTGQGESATAEFYGARGAALEKYVLECFSRLGWDAASGAVWIADHARGEIDLAGVAGDIGLLLECKSHSRPRKKLAEVVTFASEQLNRISVRDPSSLSTIPGEDAAKKLAVLSAALNANICLRIVVLAIDLEARTNAVPPYMASISTTPPLFLSLADLDLICNAFEPSDALHYLVDRYQQRRGVVFGQLDEELLLTMYIERGFLADSAKFLAERSMETTSRARYGALARHLAWRNLWAVLGGSAPPRLHHERAMGEGRAFRNAVRDYSGEGWYAFKALANVLFDQPEFSNDIQLASEYVLRSGQATVLGPWAVDSPGTLGAAQAMVFVGSWGSEQFEAMATEPIADTSTFLERRATGVHPKADYQEFHILWAPRLNRIAVKMFGAPDAVYDPRVGEPLRHKFRPTDRKLGRNERCWCGSGRKLKQCERTHWAV